ncbi:MAG: hypothetical protein SO471_07870 [Anaerobutyricum hallii]|uniref:hypothetical protein n=1 Tax=Anaerobutyricum hallii TaxID=39488 RepID=UPI002A83BCE3|nr:hypothetical protein [Anaerobutyricum hallii]MDY4577866.1 hypothetical protein [Anaerobutyricum hallii]
MTFHVGDKVRALPNSYYSITNNGWIGYVIQVISQSRIRVSANKNGRDDVYEVRANCFELVEPDVKEKEEINMVNVSEIINDEERKVLLEDMKGLLSEYDYQYTEEALNKIIDTWATNKADLITAIKKHPNYLQGKFMIVFSHNFDRTVDKTAINGFKKWLLNSETCFAVREFMTEEMRNEVIDYGRKLPNDIFCFLTEMTNMTGQYIDDYIVERLDNISPDLHAHKGQKMSRVINKLLTYVGFNKLPDYNREFAKYADALNPLQITRHTVLSVNPLDYLTMSFGNSWASCHTIDKENKRNMPNSYEGMYSSGTVSYMLDKPSMVFYTVDASYNGNDFWHEPKINRQMFHWGEEKLVQGRLYPQDNDGDNSVYTPYREIVQNIMSELFEFPNLWTVAKGTSAAGRYVCSYGTHYRDYDNYDNCTLSRIKGSENEKYINVGHDPICIKCGNEHDIQENISCCARKVTCAECGCEIDEDEARYIDGEYYCDDCSFWCDCCDEYRVGVATEVRGGGTVCSSCLEDHYTFCDDCEEYVRNRYINEINGEHICNECFEENFGPCDHCGAMHRFTDMREIAHRMLCPDCAAETESEAV